MTAAAAILLTAALLISAPSLYAAARRWFSRADADLQQHIDEALAVANEGTPIYDALVCEHMERAEGWRP